MKRGMDAGNKVRLHLTIQDLELRLGRELVDESAPGHDPWGFSYAVDSVNH